MNKLQLIAKKARIYREFIGQVSYEEDIEGFFDDDLPLLIAVAEAEVDWKRASDAVGELDSDVADYHEQLDVLWKRAGLAEHRLLELIRALLEDVTE